MVAADQPAVVDMLCRAFAAEPFVSWFVRKDEQRALGFRENFDACVELLTLPHGHCDVLEGCEGAALWTPPGKWNLGALEQLRLLPRIIRVVGLRQLVSRLRTMNQTQAFHPKEPHAYLFVLGIEPALQGKGLGSQLIQAGLNRADDAKVGAYLESSDPRNVPFYQRQGFVVRDELQIAGGPKVWFMWRDPR
jgi:ribosomal protein S18 acetylase RimI-like enzyme